MTPAPEGAGDLETDPAGDDGIATVTPGAVSPPRSPSPLRIAQRELARQTLMNAAIKAFESSGYADVTIDQIVQGAGTSRGTFYLYFQSKVEVLEAIVHQMSQDVVDGGLFDDLSTMEDPTVDRLQAWFERYVEFHCEHLHLWAAIHQALVVERDLGRMIEAGVERYSDVWEAVGRERHLDPDDLRFAGTLMFSLVDQFMYLWLYLGQDVDRAHVTRALGTAASTALSRRAT